MRKLFLLLASSFVASTSNAQLNGTYTVDAAGTASATNYLNVSSAVSDLATGTRADGGPVNGPGVTGPVTLRIVTGSGPYLEQVTFTAITGASATNTIRLTGGPGREMITFSGTTTNDRHVIKISGARHIILDSLTIVNTDATYGYGVHITNSADSNVVKNSSIITNTASTSANFAGVTISGLTVTTAGDWGDDNLIENNSINGGYYGVSMRGTSSLVFNQRNKVIGNTIQNFYYYGVYCYMQNLTQITGNTIYARTLATTATTGIYLYYADLFTVERNKLNTLGAYGIYAYYANYQGGAGTARASIVNNMIGGGWSNTTPYGMYITTNSRYLDIFHNSVSMTSGNGRAMYILSGTGHDVQNNSLAIFGSTTGYALYVTSTAYVTNVDYNNYYAPGSSNFIFIGAAYSTATFIGGGGFNVNSRQGDPVYLNNMSDLHTSAVQLFDAGTNVGVTTDYDGDTRPMAPTLFYDIGADEFAPVLNDAGVNSLTNPVAPFGAGSQNVTVTVFNYGSNTLTSATVNWDVNLVAQTPYAWTGALPTYTASTPVIIGTYNFLAGNTYNLRIWTTNPNGSADQQNANDTLYVTLCVALNGTYTVGGVGADYPTINSAVSAAVCGGIIGPVTFRLTTGAGPFVEQVIIPPITGTSAINTLRITGGPNRETVTYGATTTTERAVFKINGASYIILDSMVINNTGTTYGYGVQIQNSGDYNTVRNCIVNVSTTSTSSNFAGITMSSTTVTTAADNGDNNVIEYNTVNGGYYGITMHGPSTTVFNQNNVIRGNIIYNYYYYGIYTYEQNMPLITGNSISARPTATTAAYGIYSYYNDLFTITNNDIDSVGTYGIYMYYGNYQAGTGTARASIANNMIGASWRAATNYGMYITTNSRYIDIWHNSVSATGNGRAIYILSGLGHDVRNNSFATFASTTGYAAYITSASYVSAFDYNNYYAPGSSNFIYISGAFTTANYVGGGGWNTNSRDGDPGYVNNAYDLHAVSPQLYDAGTNLGITTDIDGDVRPMAPSTGYDIGADEFLATLNDNMVVTLLDPTDGNCPSPNAAVNVIITNNGANPITSMPITAQITGYTTATLNATYTGNLGYGQSDTVLVGTFNSAPGGTLNIVVYSVLAGDQNISNDTLTDQITITPVADVAVGANDTTCIGDSTSLTVTVDGFAHTWFDAPTGGNVVGSGDTIQTSVLMSNTTYYVESINSVSGMLTTTYTGGFGCNGIMFNVIPTVNMTVDSFAASVSSFSSELVRVFYRSGTYVGNETNSAVWTMAGIMNVNGMGAGNPTRIPIGGINMIAGQTYGIYIAFQFPVLDFANGSASFNNTDMTLNSGTELCALFGSITAGRTFNGSVYYRTQTCPNPVRTPITVTVVNPPVVSLGADTTVCAGLTLDAGNAGYSYLWSTSQTSQQISVSSSGQYNVAVSDAYCSASDTINVTVNANPTLTASAADGNICMGESDTLIVSGASTYSWSSGGNGATEIVSPTSTATYTVTGTDANGCVDSDVVTVTVNTLPNVTVSLPLDTACLTGGSITLSGESPSGGTWSGPGVSGNTFDPAVAGSGTWAITYDYTDANGCSGTAVDSILVDPCLGISSQGNIVFRLYPNPNNGTFTLALNGEGQMLVNVYDATGQLVNSEKRTKGNYTMQLPAGVYMILIEAENGTRTTTSLIVTP